MSAVARMLQINVDRNIKEIADVSFEMRLHLSQVSSGVKSQVLTNLRRGWCSSLSGQAFTMYQILAETFNFPVFSVGRSERCLISLQSDCSPTDPRVLEITDKLKIMWKLAYGGSDKADAHEWRFRTYIERGHAPGWVTINCTRPQVLDVRALCHMLDINNIFDVVPKERCLEAMRAIDSEQDLILKGFLNRTKK